MKYERHCGRQCFITPIHVVAALAATLICHYCNLACVILGEFGRCVMLCAMVI